MTTGCPGCKDAVAPTWEALRSHTGCCEGWVCPTLDRLRREATRKRDAVARIEVMKATKRSKVAA